MRRTFVLRLSAREGRAAARRIGVFMASISLGVGSLVTIHSFRRDVARSIDEEAEALMGADVRLEDQRPLTDSITVVLDSLEAAGARVARVTTAASMVLATRSDRVRMLQVRGVGAGYPFYGSVTTTPAGLWVGSPPEGAALVDPAVLIQLDAVVGDTLSIGQARFPIAGVVEDLPTDLAFQTAVGPRVHLDRASFAAAGLIDFGSVARYQAFVELPSEAEQDALEDRYRARFRLAGVRFDTAREEAEELTDGVRYLARYLGLVGLGALMLGGIGVASAVHVFVKERLGTVAVLRCIGARQSDVFLVYLLQAAALGLAGSSLGALLGVGAQHALPGLLAGAVPVDVTPRFSPLTVLAGLAIGAWVSVLFALAPLLAVRDVPPLGALRRDFDPPARRFDGPRVAAYGLLAASVAGLAALEAPTPREGLAFAAGLVAVTAALWATAVGLTRAAKRFFPRRAPYPVRQGVANLFRPQNQTVAVTLALGFGAFIVGTVLQLQAALAEELRFEADEGRPNLILFDVQPDQSEGVVALLPEHARAAATVDPIVPARVASVRGRTVAELLADTVGPRPERWALRRDYRHTFRADLADTEELVAGRWFDELPERPPDAPVRVSVESDVAESLRVVVGDTIVWDVSGVRVPSVVTSLRYVDWNRFATNFFVVFEPGAIDDAPRMDVVLANIPDEAERARFQRRLVDAFPNVSSFDIDRIQEAVASILGNVDTAIRFLALASALGGLVVLAGSLATSRHQRMREVALLKTIGARRRVVRAVLLTEYAALGSVGALAGITLSVAASWWLTRAVFELDPVLHPAPLVGVWLGVVALTVVTGGLGSRGVLGRRPLPVLREALE